MQKLHQHVSKEITPQSEPIPGSNQVANSAGGFSWEVTDWTKLDRFLTIGTESGTYYASEKELTKKSAAAVEACIKADGERVVKRVVEISDSGRAAKNDPALFVLAMASSLGDETTRKSAFAALPKVARIGTHLFHFAEYRQVFGGWGRGARNAVREWFNGREAKDTAFQVVKYQGRDGWTMRDLLRLAHPNPPTKEHAALYQWIINGKVGAVAVEGHKRAIVSEENLPEVVQNFEKLKSLKDDVKKAAKLIRATGLPREAVPTELLTKPEIWNALLDKMPLEALVRNLGNLSKCGLLVPLSDAEKTVIAKLSDKESIKKSRIHPIKALAALLTYGQGHGFRGSGQWEVCRKVTDKLDSLFYAAFGNVEPTNKNILLALDVSGSMRGSPVSGIPGLDAAGGAAVMAMVTARVEPNHHIMAFSDRLVDIDISAKDRLDRVLETMRKISFGGTDCALPMLWATQTSAKVDAFVTYTDSETWAGKMHPAQALKQYRKKVGVQAKSVVVAMCVNDFTIADPTDPGMLDVAGFDTASPTVISNFIAD